jgi:hypothetical protein
VRASSYKYRRVQCMHRGLGGGFRTDEREKGIVIEGGGVLVMTWGEDFEENVRKWYCYRPRREKCIQDQTKWGIRRGTLSFMYGRSRCLVLYCIGQLMATSDVAQTGQAHAVCALGVVRTDSSPAVRTTEPDGVSRVVACVDNGRVDGLSCKVLECTLIGTGGLAIDLDHITTEEGCDPIIWPRGEGNTAGDTDIGAGVVDGQLASGNCLAVVAADLGPLEDVVTVGDPRRDLHVLAFALMRVTGVEAVAVAVPSVTLALDDWKTTRSIQQKGEGVESTDCSRCGGIIADPSR